MKKKNNFSVRLIAETAIISAIGFGLDILAGGLFRGVFPNGGSISIAMVPIFLLCYRRGFVPGLIASFIVTLLQMAGGIYAIASEWYNVMFQLILDYIIAYPLISVAGLFYKPLHKSNTNKERIKWILIGTILGGFLKYLSHFLSGVLFWQNYDFPGGPFVYSMAYNASYMMPSIAICTLIMVILVIKAPQLFLLEKVNKGEIKNEQVTNN